MEDAQLKTREAFVIILMIEHLTRMLSKKRLKNGGTNFASGIRRSLTVPDCLNDLICRQRCDDMDRIGPRESEFLLLGTCPNLYKNSLFLYCLSSSPLAMASSARATTLWGLVHRAPCCSEACF